MQDVTLLEITVITDDDTGIYTIGELDFRRTGHCNDFLEKDGNRKKFADRLRWLADAAENHWSPFGPTFKPSANESPVFGDASGERSGNQINLE